MDEPTIKPDNRAESPIQPQPEKQANRMKFWLPVVLAVIVIIGYLVYANTASLWPFGSSGPESGSPVWQTYSNQYYSLQTLPDWKEQENDIGSGLDGRLAGYTYGSYIDLDCEFLNIDRCKAAPPHVNLTVLVYNYSEELRDKYSERQDYYYFENQLYSYWIFVSYNNMSENSAIFRNENMPVVEQVISSFNSASPTAEQITYRNEEYGFEFRYPEDWYFKANPYDNSLVLTLDPPEVSPASHLDTDLPYAIKLSVYSKISQLDSRNKSVRDLNDFIDEYSKPTIDSPYDDSYIEENVEIISQRGISWYKAKAGPNVFGGGEYYFAEDASNNIYQFVTFNLVGPEWVYSDLFNQILSTFRFIGSNSEVKTYSSSNLGISFEYYLPGYEEPVVEEGNKVYVGGRDRQSIEVFAKDPNDSLADAISQQFLSGISDQDCWVTTTTGGSSGFQGAPSFPDNYEKGSIHYPIEGDDWFEAMAQSKCPKMYQSTNGISYFLYDHNHPSKFFFFSIGQDSIPAEPGTFPGKKSWQDTFRVVN